MKSTKHMMGTPAVATALVALVLGCGNLRADVVVDLSSTAWEYDSANPNEGNTTETAPGNSAGMFLNYRILPPPEERFSMYRYVHSPLVALEEFPSVVKAEILGDDSGVGIVLHFVDSVGTNHLYRLVRSVQWSGWTDIEESWETLGHSAWGSQVPEDSPTAGADVPVEFPLVLKGITIQGPDGSAGVEGKLGIQNLTFVGK
jgi:hypothetical protein